MRDGKLIYSYSSLYYVVGVGPKISVRTTSFANTAATTWIVKTLIAILYFIQRSISLSALLLGMNSTLHSCRIFTLKISRIIQTWMLTRLWLKVCKRNMKYILVGEKKKHPAHSWSSCSDGHISRSPCLILMKIQWIESTRRVLSNGSIHVKIRQWLREICLLNMSFANFPKWCWVIFLFNFSHFSWWGNPQPAWDSEY